MYIDKDEFLQEILECQANNNTISPRLEDLFLLLIERVGTKFSYMNDSDRHDCKTNALLTLFNKWVDFDINKTDNAFAYMTTIVMNGYRAGFVELYPQYNSRKSHLITSIISTNNIHTL